VGVGGVFQLASAYGPIGLVVGWLLYERWAKDRAQEKLDASKAVERAKLEEKRLAFDRERLECDKAMAGALSGMTAVLQSVSSMLQDIHRDRHG
jgi:hypothetical protein